ncbi:alpha-adducin-like isoform X2 [Ptychodera flava]|uniref:alpha-adducin-like isoform X2 n=1 Tax=Ptychodera flava TaxID=63121 RepID=UPI003969D80E
MGRPSVFLYQCYFTNSTISILFSRAARFSWCVVNRTQSYKERQCDQDFEEEFDQMASNTGVSGHFAKALESTRTVAGLHRYKFPICDNDLDNINASPEEKELRCKLAAVYRLIDLYGWSNNIFNHITVNASKDNTQFLINPFGLMFYEVSASNLIKVDLEGNILERGSTEYECFRPGWLLQSAVHAARPDLQCLIHVHTPAGTAVSAMKCGLLKCSQDALLAGEIANHPYRGIFMDEEEMKSIVESLGRSAKVLILQNHGLLVGGDTIEDAFFRLTHVMAACEVQIRLMASGNLDNIILPEEMMLDKERQVILRDRKTSGRVMTKSGTAMPVKELQFEAQVRMLDIMGLKTGYKYKKMPKAFLEKKTQ